VNPELRIAESKPMSLCDRTARDIACALSVLRARYPGVVTTATPLEARASEELGADWLIDVFFVSPRFAEEFEDFADMFSVGLADALGVQVVIMSHSEEATQKYYLDRLRACCAFAVENRVRSDETVTSSSDYAPDAARSNWEAIPQSQESAQRKAA
jgi:FAD/FMN-containing dehydrogenase